MKKTLRILTALLLCTVIVGSIFPINFISQVQDFFLSETDWKEDVKKEVNHHSKKTIKKEEPKIQKLEKNLLEKLDHATGEEKDLIIASLKNTNTIKIKSFFKELGMNDNMIAGVIATFSCESNLDPTFVETIYEEKLDKQRTPKFYTIKDKNNLLCKTVFVKNQYVPALKKSAYYYQEDEKYYPGIGIAQFTGVAAKRLIDYASNIGLDWYSLDIQLMFIVDPAGYMYLQSPYSSQSNNWIFNWIAEKANTDITPAQAANEWNENFERAYDSTIKEALAEEIAPYISELPVDEDYAKEMINWLNHELKKEE